MVRLMDVNPFKGRDYRGGESIRTMDETVFGESRFKRMKDFCLSCCPNSWGGWLVVLLAAALLWQASVSLGWFPSLTFPAVDKDKWQAVFLNNDQVYFGHLQEKNRDYAVLKNTYYFRAAEQSPSNQQQQINLIKLGNELHGPEDEIYIPKNQILFWENLKSDSQVARIINQLEGSQ